MPEKSKDKTEILVSLERNLTRLFEHEHDLEKRPLSKQYEFWPGDKYYE